MFSLNVVLFVITSLTCKRSACFSSCKSTFDMQLEGRPIFIPSCNSTPGLQFGGSSCKTPPPICNLGFRVASPTSIRNRGPINFYTGCKSILYTQLGFEPFLSQMQIHLRHAIRASCHFFLSRLQVHPMLATTSVVVPIASVGE